MEKEYKALVVNEVNAAFEQTIQTLHIDNLPKGDVLVKVHYSSINYKDALSATGNKGITKKYPHTPATSAASSGPGKQSGTCGCRPDHRRGPATSHTRPWC